MEVTLIELFVTGGIPFGAMVAAWIDNRVKVASLKQQLKYLEKQIDDEKDSNKENYANIREDIKSIFKILTEIKVKIGNS